MSQPETNFSHAIQQAHKAMRRGDRMAARRWAEKATSLNAQSEEAWMLLAALASPRASLAYLKKALDINPDSQLARRGMRWAVKRARHTGNASRKRKIVAAMPTSQSTTLTRPALLSWAVAALIIFLGLTAWFSTPTFSLAFSDQPQSLLSQVNLGKPTLTPTHTATFTPTLTFTPTNTPTNTPLPTDTPIPTQVPPTDIPNIPGLPPGMGANENWIDVDLSLQRTSAYTGTNLVRTFIVSTGTYLHPTVTGTYRVYVKYRYTDMAGPGYYLPDVPYTMYFYKGYGLHGTYWHNNFGTPMSHGCVNLTIPDAGWLFDFAVVGTIVFVHY